MSRLRGVLAALPVFLALAGCSESPKSATVAEGKQEGLQAPEPVSGQSAFYKILFSARIWATDAQPVRVAQ